MQHLQKDKESLAKKLEITKQLLDQQVNQLQQQVLLFVIDS
jgi:hypothetical protein